MRTIGEILKLSQKYLEDHQVLNPRRSAEEILSFFLKKPRLELYMNFEMPIQEKELEGIRELLKRRSKGEPFDYLTGRVKFHQLDLIINASVLIPRPETEILLSKIVESLKKIDLNEKVAWDICCGSGCLGLGLKKALPDLKLVLSDISEKALNAAKANGEKNGVEAVFFHGDLLKPFQGMKADFILCNPPYISKKEYEGLHREVRDFEPKEALCAGESGVEFYQRLALELPPHLNGGAKIFFEIGYNQGEAVKKIFSSPYWKDLTLEKDWAGHDRYISLEYFP